jgi:Ca2+:H+ antiporter
MGEGAGGLNATFGNAAELIIAAIALSKGLSGVVSVVAGSIITTFCSCSDYRSCAAGQVREQRFNRLARTSVISSWRRSR